MNIFQKIINYINFLRTEIFIVFALLISVFLGGVYFHKHFSKCPEIKKGVITIDTVITYDTITIPITRTKISEKRVPVEIYIRDTVTKEISVLPDTSNCFEYDTAINGAYISAEMCSRFFPVHKPLDLSASLSYKPPPDTQKLRLDTIVYKKPFYCDRKNYIILGLSGLLATSLYYQFK